MYVSMYACALLNFDGCMMIRRIFFMYVGYEIPQRTTVHASTSGTNARIVLLCLGWVVVLRPNRWSMSSNPSLLLV